jgi:phospholipid/cholesterol/gamma-HCH transport system substrate-binding protein
MEKKGIATEVKVGFFVFLGLAVLAYMTLQVEKYKLRAAQGYEMTAFFKSVSGLVVNSPIQIAGIEVGRVKDIRLVGDKARVAMIIRKEAPVYADAQAIIKSQGVLGDKFIELVPGTLQDRRLTSGGIIAQTRSSIELDDLLAKASPVMDDIRSVTRSVGEVLGTEEGKNNLKETFLNVKKTTEDVRAITLGLSHGEGTIGKLIRDDSLYNDMKTTVAGLRDTVGEVREGKGSLGKLLKDEAFFNDTQKALASLQNMAQKIESGEGTLGKLINDDSLYKEAKETVANLNQVTQKINQGEGTIGKLVKDESLYKETKYTLRSITKAAEGFVEQVPVSILGTIIGTVIK